MKFTMNHTIEALERTAPTLRSLLFGMSSEWVMNNYGKDTFSAFDVVGHLIHAEKVNWIQRIECLLAYGDTRAFDPFDRYAMYESSKGKSMEQLLDEFEGLRRENVQKLKSMTLSETDLDRVGRHPDPSFAPVSLRNLLATWAVHDLHHIAQICKAMAFQYKDHVGAWNANLGILPR